MKKALKIILICILSLVAVFAALAVVNFVIELRMRSYVDSFSKVEPNADAPTLQYDKNGDPYFVSDRDLKILQLTDVHIGGGFLSVDEDKKVINAVAAMVEAERPDLIVVTGDISFAVPTPRRSSSAVIPKRSARDTMRVISGYDSPHSHFDTALEPTPTLSPSSCCVRPFSFLSLDIKIPVLLLFINTPHNLIINLYFRYFNSRYSRFS